MSAPSILARRLNILIRAKYKFVVGNEGVLEKLESAQFLAHLGPQRDSGYQQFQNCTLAID